jgi:DhnA family fructose-bisphosphate aldolase class Ia
MNIQARLNRLFAADGKCFDVAIDHGFFNERSFLNGIEDLSSAVKTVVAAGPDAIQLPPGTAPSLQNIPGAETGACDADRCCECLRKNFAEEIVQQIGRAGGRTSTHSRRSMRGCEFAVASGSAGAAPSLHWKYCALKPQCVRYGMPLMIEPLVMQSNEKAGGYMVDGT